MLRSVAVLFGALAPVVFAQSPNGPTPRDYRGPQVHIDGVWVTPVPNAPFSANVEILSHNQLPDGTDHIVRTENTIARASSGRIRNERRALVPAEFKGVPRLISAHIYDPNTGVNVFTDTATHLARQTVLPTPMRTPVSQLPPGQQRKDPRVVEEPLGDQTFDGVTLTGTRKTHVIPAALSGTGKDVTITDDYWFSTELSLYLIIRHNDPRTGEQLVAVTHIQRGEPPADLLQVPTDYKVVDETPPPGVMNGAVQ